MSSSNAPIRIAFALTSHGYGHLTRSLAVTKELLCLYPYVEAVVSTTIPRERVARELHPFPFRYRPRAYEPGARQKNCFVVDLESTQEAYREFFASRAVRLEEEERFLSECRGLVSDIPALPVRAAANVGTPAVGLANFTWDWILEPLFRGAELAEIRRQLAEDYSCGDLLLRLPFSPSENPFRRSEDAPLVGRLAQLEPDDVRARLGIESGDSRRLGLVCAGGWGPGGWSSIHVAGCAGFRWLVVGNLPITADGPTVHLPGDLPQGLGFADLVGASDVVVTKPGYGIASECVLNRTPFVAIERRGFRESAQLVTEFQSMGPLAELSLEDFTEGRWESALVKACGSEQGWVDCPRDGATRVARRLGAFFGLDRTI